MRVTLEFPGGTVVVTDVTEPFLATVNRHITEGQLTLVAALAFFRDIAYFERNRTTLAREHAGHSVAIVDEHLYRADSDVDAIDMVETANPGRLYYLVDIPPDGTLPDLIDAAAPPLRYRYEESNGRISARRVG